MLVLSELLLAIEGFLLGLFRHRIIKTLGLVGEQ